MTKLPYHASPRCGAKTKRNDGLPCCSPAVRGRSRCRMHGGSKGSGGQIGNTNALKHGEATKKMKTFRKKVKQLITESMKLKHAIDSL